MASDAERVTYNKLGFFKKFLELNKVMWDTNSGLTSSHPYDSRPEVNSLNSILLCNSHFCNSLGHYYVGVLTFGPRTSFTFIYWEILLFIGQLSLLFWFVSFSSLYLLYWIKEEFKKTLEVNIKKIHV